MFKKHKIFKALATVSAVTIPVVAVACAAPAENQPVQDPTKFSDLPGAERGRIFDNFRYYNSNLWYSFSAEKDAMTLTAYQGAKVSYDAMKKQTDTFDFNAVSVVKDANGKITSISVKNPTSGKAVPVVWMDLDETVVNNYKFQNYILLNDKKYNSEIWNQFVNDKQSTELPGAFDFIRYVWSNGGVVIFNSNRDLEKTKEATKQNLIDLGLEAALLPDWVFWMQGVDETKEQPWAHIKKDDKGKVIKTNKEVRANVMNEKTQGFNLDTNGANAVVLKTIMRVGDNFDDFNDNASHGKLNTQRVSILNKDLKQLFGNTNTSVKGVKFNKQGEKSATNWSESYIFIGGNASYGGWEPGLMIDYFKKSGEEKQRLLNELLETFAWVPSKPVN
ncbi:HAD family acid phosphatase [Candidatus Mycoplasma pogonae]